jgi:1-acyl-sn-glycerol-3-phosphate acyltransferase
MSIGDLVRTGITYFFITLLAIICLIPCVIIICLPERYRYGNRVFFWFMNIFFKGTFYSLCMPITIQGKDTIPEEPVIFVANHQSSLDIPVVGSLCDGRPHLWLVLEYYSNTPVLGFFIKRMFVSVDQKNPTKAARSIIQALYLAKDYRQDIIIFPEGGRYNNGTIHEFFEGFAVIAKRANYPVVPVYMPNNGKIFPPHSLVTHYYPLRVIIGKPMEYLPQETYGAFTQRVQDWFIDIASESSK